MAVAAEAEIEDERFAGFDQIDGGELSLCDALRRFDAFDDRRRDRDFGELAFVFEQGFGLVARVVNRHEANIPHGLERRIQNSSS